MAKIYILTGELHSGKTTKLMQWAIGKTNLLGIFQPVIDGKRFIYDIKSRTLNLLEVDNEKSYPIGKYKLSIDTFDWAKQIIKTSSLENFEWLIVDEVGPLELEGKGLEPAISEIINRSSDMNGNLLFVVREKILSEFVKYFSLEDKYTLFNLM